LINAENLHQQNLKHCSYNYQIDQEVLVKFPNPSKLQDHVEGPFQIQQVHGNGTLKIQQAPMSPSASTFEECCHTGNHDRTRPENCTDAFSSASCLIYKQMYSSN
jgi:hypothetical protein